MRASSSLLNLPADCKSVWICIDLELPQSVSNLSDSVCMIPAWNERSREIHNFMEPEFLHGVCLGRVGEGGFSSM